MRKKECVGPVLYVQRLIANLVVVDRIHANNPAIGYAKPRW